MYIICPSYGTTCKSSGITHHIRQSKDPCCHLPDIFQQPENQEDNPSAGPATGMMNSDENKPEDQLHFSVDPSGGLFGDYANYEGLDVREGDEGDQVMGNDTKGEAPECPIDAEHKEHNAHEEREGHNAHVEHEEHKEPEHNVYDVHEEHEEADDVEEEQDEEEAELDDAVLVEENRLEPEQPTGLPDTFEQEPEDTPSEQAQAPFCLRRGFERPLANRPKIVEFNSHNTGTVYGRAYKNANQDYRRAVSSSDGSNIYAPFSSKLDWEVACWAKM